jgi:hypothetical protein
MYLPLPIPVPSDNDPEETHDLVDLSLDLHSETDRREHDVLSEMDGLQGKHKEDLMEDTGFVRHTAADNSTHAVAQGLIRALVGMAENPEDGLQRICLETLAELGT